MFRTWCSENPNEVNDKFKNKIYSMCREIVRLEEDFIDFAFNSYKIQGITKEEVKTYIKFIADRRLLQLGLKANFGVVSNPLEWFDILSNGSSLQNFFEGRSADYAVVGLTGEWTY